ncbi:MAG TPA: hypothetical protein PLF31_01760 [Candidatus Paceibacterota bacterium]|nr:hypothetical protein [Candidatus Paceibacterota bacterium]
MKNIYWTSVEEEAVESAKSMNELADIALGVLESMAAQKKPIVEICGAMSTGGFENDIKQNMALFEAMIDAATEKGHIVFNQLVFQRAMDRFRPDPSVKHYAWEILDVFYGKVFASGYIGQLFFSPNWFTSVGASWELLESFKLRMNRGDYPINWLPDPWQQKLFPFQANRFHSVILPTEAELREYCNSKLKEAA